MERDERLVHRLEAFCDIVIGFSLAELTFGLVIPAHAIGLVTNPTWLIYYLFTFSIVALMWWSHYRLFQTIFYPDTPNILLNYAWLASVGLLVFFMQVTARAQTPRDTIVAADLYFTTLAVNFALNATMMARSYRRRGNLLDESGRTRVLRVIISSLLSAPLLLVGLLWAGTSKPSNAVYIPLAMAIGFGGGRPLLLLWTRLRNRHRESRERDQT